MGVGGTTNVPVLTPQFPDAVLKNFFPDSTFAAVASHCANGVAMAATISFVVFIVEPGPALGSWKLPGIVAVVPALR
jgi:hypothetical protein